MRSLGINLPVAVLFPLLLGEFGLLPDGSYLVIILFLCWGWGLIGIMVKCIRNLTNLDNQYNSPLYRLTSCLIVFALISITGFIVLDLYLP
jgi:predicted membrane channel-forming protein YqfA (hemolysin III family)